MFRRIEFILYVLAILFFIVRYSNFDDEDVRRPRTRPPEEGAVLVPDGAPLPDNDEVEVDVEVGGRVGNSVGTAFAVDRDGTYVTARHVVDGCSEVYLGYGERQWEPVLSSVSEGMRDFAVLRANRMRARPFALSDRTPRRGEDGYMMGFPQGHPGDVRATVIGATHMRSTGRYTMREPVVAWVERERRPTFGGSLGGISGGPVFSEAGYVVGTVVAGAPRRGRVYTTHPRVFRETGLMRDDAVAIQGVGRTSFEKRADSLRAHHAIAQVYCRAS